MGRDLLIRSGQTFVPLRTPLLLISTAATYCQPPRTTTASVAARKPSRRGPRHYVVGDAHAAGAWVSCMSDVSCRVRLFVLEPRQPNNRPEDSVGGVKLDWSCGKACFRLQR